MTPNALKFVREVPAEAVVDIFSRNFYTKTEPTWHIEATRNADLFLAYPASMNFISECVNGATNYLPSLVFSCVLCPKIIQPAMNTVMYNSFANQTNLSKLKKWGVIFLEPVVGELACGTWGIGRAWEPETMLDYLRHYYLSKYTSDDSEKLKNET